MNCLLKKYLLKTANKLIETYRNDIETARLNVNVWLKRAETITKFLTLLSQQLEDGSISEEELKAAIEGFRGIVQKW